MVKIINSLCIAINVWLKSGDRGPEGQNMSLVALNPNHYVSKIHEWLHYYILAYFKAKTILFPPLFYRINPSLIFSLQYTSYNIDGTYRLYSYYAIQLNLYFLWRALWEIDSCATSLDIPFVDYISIYPFVNYVFRRRLKYIITLF